MRTVNGKVPDQRAVENAVQNVTSRKDDIPHINCANCGRTSIAQHATMQKHMCRSTCAYEISRHDMKAHHNVEKSLKYAFIFETAECRR